MRIEGRDLVDLVLSWSLEEVLDVDLYKGQVDKIPMEYKSTGDYFKSFIPPLIEETHAALLSSMKRLCQAPVVEIRYVMQTAQFKLPNDLFYKVCLSGMNDEVSTTQLIPRDLIALRPNRSDSFDISNEPYVVALVCKADPDRPNDVIILASKPLFIEKKDSLFGLYMTNLTTNIRIWNALHPGVEGGNLNLISRVLRRSCCEDDGFCIQCLLQGSDGLAPRRFLKLNPSQENAILSCLDVRRCYHTNTIKLIWGPPGTGKTKTTSVMLFTLLNAKCRTLTCGPTNVSVLEVASRVVKLVSASLKFGNYGFGDVVLFGNEERMKIRDRRDLVNFFIDERVDKLYPCFMPFSGWRATVESMIRLLEDPKGEYNEYLARVNSVKRKNSDSVFKSKRNDQNKNLAEQVVYDFQEYLPKRFNELRKDLDLLFTSLCTHLPTALLSSQAATRMYETVDLIRDATVLALPYGEGLKSVLIANKGSGRQVEEYYLKLLRSIPEIFTLPGVSDKHLIKELCLGHAFLLFSTVSCSARLYTGTPIQLLVIDEAAQLKECETAIPLQLPGIQHSILIGDERQLPAMVESQIALEAGFGRSLFERLALLGHKKYLLNMQYRMHPSVSIFPNKEFYEMKIQDAPMVRQRNYTKQYLPGGMYGPYSFINIACGREEYGQGRSLKNIVEVAVVADIVASLLQVSKRTKTRINVGVISPYKAQVFAIKDKVQETCRGDDAGGLFSLKIQSVDAFQGGEEDIIVVSTVRSNGVGRVGFLANRRRTNVLLTRARFCLWILGNEATLTNSKSVWRNLIQDAKERGCFHSAREDKSLAKAIASVSIEFDRPLNNSTWKLCFSDEFKNYAGEIKDSEIYRKVKNLLDVLAQGSWLHEQEEDSLLKQSKIDDVDLRLIWAVDILKEGFDYVQVVKIWDVVTSSQAPETVKHIGLNYMRYTRDEVEKCRGRSIRGDVVVPMTWCVESIHEVEKEEEDIEVDILSDLFASKLTL
ncbi:unnamed protein product [Cochlearia groenlandica]